MAKKSSKASARRSPVVRIPASVRGFVEKRVEAGGFADESEYLAHLVKEDQRQAEAAHRRLVQLAREGLASGPDIPVDDAYWERKKATLRAKLTKQRKVG
jgi:antitoxin ParD1/3/4